MLTQQNSEHLPVDSFSERLNHVCGQFIVEPNKSQSLVKGTVQLECRAGMEIAHIAKDLQSIRRTRTEISQDDAEHLFLIVQEEGCAMMAQQDSVHLLQPGDMVLIDSAEPSDFSFFGNYGRQLSVHLPREEIRQRFGQCVQGGKFLSRRDYITIAMNAVLAKVFEPDCNDRQNAHLKEAMLGLLGAWLFEQRAVKTNRQLDVDASGAQLLRNGLAYLDRMFKNSDLTIQIVATDLGVSARQLQRAFALIDTSPSDYLLQKRLEHACQLLLARRSGKAKALVSSIAYSCGFNDVSYFNRQFRRHFNCAPGEFGNEASAVV